MIVFCSDSHTAKGHIAVGNSAERLLEGGTTAVAIAPVGLAEGSPETTVQQIVAVGDADGGAQATAEALASALGATVAPVANQDTDLLVVDSRPEAQQGRVSISSSAAHLIEIATCAVLVVPRGVTLSFAGRPSAQAPSAGALHTRPRRARGRVDAVQRTDRPRALVRAGGARALR